MANTEPRGVILYDGPSTIDGAPIVLIATIRSRNVKTGDMIQTWILRSDKPPIEAINDGADESICGDCPLRGIVEDGRNRMRGCYVSVKNAPFQVYEAYRRGSYPIYDKLEHAELFRGRKLRLGAYGDPVAVPLNRWKPFLRLSASHTGYTHQWKKRRYHRWARYLMASTHTIKENQLARSRGWRSFRTRTADQPVQPDEIICPASPEGSNRRTCETCMACDGGNVARRSVTIITHGSPATLSGASAALKVLQ